MQEMDAVWTSLFPGKNGRLNMGELAFGEHKPG
jgi:hypothetical protein